MSLSLLIYKMGTTTAPHEVAVRIARHLALAVCTDWLLFFHVYSILHANVDIHLFTNE